MNMRPNLGTDRLRSAARVISPLKRWRKKQMVKGAEGDAVRPMRLTDVPRLYGISTSTWHQWEQLPGDSEFRCPTPANMKRICGEITKGEVKPGDFYALAPWNSENASGG